MNKKILSGNLILPIGLLEKVSNSAEIFKNLITSELPNCDYDIYEAEYNNEDVVAISFAIVSRTFKQCEADYKYFKKIIKDTFEKAPEQVMLIKKERI